jgi:hypothetical protein
MNNPQHTSPKSVGMLLGDICEVQYINLRGFGSPRMTALILEVAQAVGVDLITDELFTPITPEQEQAVYRELAKRYLVRFQDAHGES